MKKFVLAALIMGFAFTAFAQEDKVIEKKKTKESQEIVIRSKGDKEKKITVIVDGDNVTVNGKPMSEFKDDDIIVNKRTITIREKNGTNIIDVPGDGFMKEFESFSSTGKAESRAFLGVTTEDDGDGARITDITKESAAAKAGLKEGDIITKVGTKKVDGPESLLDAITAQKPKDEVAIYYKRDGKENQVKATLGERKEYGTMAYSFSGPDGMARTYTIPRVPGVAASPQWYEKQMDAYSAPKTFGMTENNFRFMEGYYSRQRLGIKIQDTEEGNGVKVLDVEKDSPAEKGGLKKDDIVTEIGGKKVSNTDEAREQLQETREKSSYNIKAKRNGADMNFDIKIPKKLKTANL